MTDQVDITDRRCGNCDKAVTADFYCYGCDTHICSECDKNLGLTWGHEFDDHLTDEVPADEGWDEEESV